MSRIFSHASIKPPSEMCLFDRWFDDVDELTEMTREWDLEFYQLIPGKFNGRVFQAIFGLCQITYAKFNCKIKQQGLSPKNLRSIAIPANSDLSLFWRGYHVSGNDLMIFPPSGELESISEEDFEVYILSIPEDYLAEISQILGLSNWRRLLNGAEVVTCQKKHINTLRTALEITCQNIVNRPTILNSKVFHQNLRLNFSCKVLLALAEAKALPLKKWPSRRARALIGAENLIVSNSHKKITVGKLCQELNVSERTLRNAFYDRYGISPKAYLKAYKLNQVRRALRLAHPESTKISDLAGHWGFWHMGQFAKDYKAMFCELPSETLNLRSLIK